MNMFVDGSVFERYVEVNDEEAAALSSVCKSCLGLCCSHFRVRTPRHAVDGAESVDYEAWLARAEPGSELHENVEFARSHWVEAAAAGWDQTEFTCKALDPVTHLCNSYCDRPSICRSYICGSAWLRGMPPDGEYQRMTSQGPGMPFAGMVPAQVVDPLWARTIGKRLEREDEERRRASAADPDPVGLAPAMGGEAVDAGPADAQGPVCVGDHGQCDIAYEPEQGRGPGGDAHPEGVRCPGAG